MLNRMKAKERREKERLIEEGARRGRASGTPALGTPTGSGVSISAALESGDYADEEGRTVRPFMLGVDALGDPRRPLRVNGKKRNYYG